MTDDPPVNRSADQADLVGVALGSIAAGATGGAAAVALGLVTLRHRLTNLLPLLLFAGIVVAVSVAWTLARPIADWWRRGVTAAIAVFAAMLLTAVTAPVDMAAGTIGVLAFATIMIGAAAFAARYVRRSRTRGW
ncbi:MAG: hypothetical protein OEY20_02685 [Gemmatimonadota bacterium]|nr:hypothetical protein [Gemmatimonadota bacterium]MDH5196142.1 hypothetical protein [Gemmatimonadota bacterium]